MAFLTHVDQEPEHIRSTYPGGICHSVLLQGHGRNGYEHGRYGYEYGRNGRYERYGRYERNWVAKAIKTLKTAKTDEEYEKMRNSGIDKQKIDEKLAEELEWKSGKFIFSENKELESDFLGFPVLFWFLESSKWHLLISSTSVS